MSAELIHPYPQSHLTVAETLSQWPQCARVFLSHHMSCVGCSMNRFDTLVDVTTIYRLDLGIFLTELSAEIQPATGTGING